MVIAAAGPPRRQLPTEVPPGLSLPEGFREPRVCLPGVLAVQAPSFGDADTDRFCDAYQPAAAPNDFPLVILVDDSDFTARSLNNLMWVTWMRSNPAADLHGIGAFVRQKHWGCEGALVIDARGKPHHAPPLVEDPTVSKRVDALAAPGGPLHGIL